MRLHEERTGLLARELQPRARTRAACPLIRASPLSAAHRPQLPPKRLHDEVSKKFTERWNKAVLGLHSLLTDMLTGAPK